MHNSMYNKVHDNPLHQYASKFTLCFTRFSMKLNKFIIVKVGNPLVNMDQLLWKNESINS